MNEAEIRRIVRNEVNAIVRAEVDRLMLYEVETVCRTMTLGVLNQLGLEEYFAMAESRKPRSQ